MNETMDYAKELVTFSFYSPTEKNRTFGNVISSKKKFTSCSNSGEENGHFQKGLLLETVEKGVTYPLVHRGSIQNYFHKGEEDKSMVIAKGCYQEMEKVRVDLFGSALDALSTHSDEKGPNLSTAPWGRFFVVLGFKQLPIASRAEVLESHWKEWTGARYLFLNLPHEFGPIRITFYKRFTPDDFGLFLYLVVAECLRVTPRDRIHLEDFVQRMRADKMPFYLALYRDADGPSSEQKVLRSKRAGSSGVSSSMSSLSEEVPTSPRMTSTPIFGSPIAAFHSRVTFLEF